MKEVTIDEELAALKTQAERADWLIRAPEGVIAGYGATVRRHVELAGFAEGVVYLQARIDAVWTARAADGRMFKTVGMAVFHAEGVMKEAARVRDGGKHG